MATGAPAVVKVDFRGTKQDLMNAHGTSFTPVMISFRNALWQVEQLYKQQPQSSLEALFSIPSLDIHYQIWITCTKISSEWSFSCASVYVKNQIAKEASSIIALFNLQLDDDNQLHYGETVVVSMKKVSEKFKIKFQF